MAEQAGRTNYEPSHTRPGSFQPDFSTPSAFLSIAQPHASRHKPAGWLSAPSTSSNACATAFDHSFSYVSLAATDQSQLGAMPASAGSRAVNSDSLVRDHWDWTKGTDEGFSSIQRDDIEVEEITSSDIGYDSDIEVVRPDQIEDADKGEESSSREKSQDPESDEASLLDRFRQLSCGLTNYMEDAGHAGRLARKKKRWSSGILKRTYSQSNLGSDNDDDGRDEMDRHDVDSNTRRLRRRVGGSDARSSLIFEDLSGPSVTETEELVVESPADSAFRDSSEGLDNNKEQTSTPSGSSMEIDSDAGAL